jgi:uncharacterized protein (TIGR03083 family)
MTGNTFAPWVEPIAAQLREGRARIAETARRMPAEAWGRLSPNEGWSNKDLLAHLTFSDWALQSGFRRIFAGKALRISDFADVDETNARGVAERAGRSVEELIAEVEAEGEETQELLARLTDAQEGLTPEDVPATMGDYLRRYVGHDQAHLAELQRAMPG